MPTVNITPDPRLQFVDENGAPYASAQLFTYLAGTTTKKATYTTSAGSVANDNPIVLNARGETPNQVWLEDGVEYKFVLAPAGDTDPPASPIRTDDNITGVNDIDLNTSQWAESGLTPTYVSATQFTLAGDQTTDFHVGRRLKTTNTSGDIYSFISASSYSDPNTTVTVVNDSGTLDSGLSAVSYGILTVTNPSVPKLVTAQYSDSSVTTAKIADDNVTLAKLAGSTAGHALTYDSSGDPQTETYMKWYKLEEGSISGASVNITGIPSSCIALKVVGYGVSLSGTTDTWGIQIGIAGGLQITGYNGIAKTISATAATNMPFSTSNMFTIMPQPYGVATQVTESFVFEMWEMASNTWVESSTASEDARLEVYCGSGYKALSNELAQIGLVTDGSNTFDAGTYAVYVYGNPDV